MTPINSFITVVFAHLTGHSEMSQVLDRGALIFLHGTHLFHCYVAEPCLRSEQSEIACWELWDFQRRLMGARCPNPIEIPIFWKVGMFDGNDGCTLHIVLLCPLDWVDLPLGLVNTSLVGCSS